MLEVKKTPEADLENKRPTWLLTGYVMALSFLFVAFEWTGGDGRSEAGKPFAGQVFEEELVPLVEPPAEVPLPPPPVAVPPVAEEVAVVDEEAETAPVQLLSPEDVGQGLATAGRVAERPDAGTLVADEPVVQTAEVMPSFPGGVKALMGYLSRHVAYPPDALRSRTQGLVLVGFVVNGDGSIADVQVLQGAAPSLDREAVRVVSSMPKWKPGTDGGRAVRVRYTLPVQFRLQ